jgi:hypothetical protein
LIDNNLGWYYKCKTGLYTSFKLHQNSDFHINNINNENASENKPEYGNEDEGDSSPTESDSWEISQLH